MERRGFLKGILALAAAPAIVRASSLMPVAPKLWVPEQSLLPASYTVIEDATGVIEAYDAMIVDSIIYGTGYTKILWPGVNALWDDTYTKLII